MQFGRWNWDTLSNPQARGFVWGAGTAMAAYYFWPSVTRVVRPVTKGAIRGAMVAGDRFRYAMARTREGLEDIFAEAQFDRMRDAADPAGDSTPDLTPSI